MNKEKALKNQGLEFREDIVERGGCIMSKKNHHPVSAEVENNPLYHDTYKLLRCYRDSTYSLMVAVRRVGKARSQYLLPDVLSKEAGCY